jgi:hypothetical protein
MSISHNEAAIAILAKAVEQLQAIGVDCILSPLTLPQGASVSLHAGEGVRAVIAADVATLRGAELAHQAGSANDFANDVAEALAEATILKAAHTARNG